MDDHNIDKLFKEKLKDFKEVPDEKVWSTIQASLNKKDKKRRIIPIWWRWAGAAAILVMALILFLPKNNSLPAGNEVSDSEEQLPVESIVTDREEATPNATSPNTSLGIENKEEVVDSNGNATVQDSRRVNGQKSSKTGISGADSAVATVANKAQSTTESGLDNTKATEPSGAIPTVAENPVDNAKTQENETITETQSEVVNNTLLENSAENVINPSEESAVASSEEVEDKKERSIFEEVEDELIDSAQDSGNKWSVGPSVAPVYYNAIGTGSPVDSRFTGNDKSGAVSMSYGLTVGYNVSKKWELRTGIHRVDYGYRTDDIAFTSSFNNPVGEGLENINYIPTSTNLIVQSQVSKVNTDELAISNDVEAQNPIRTGRMVQEMGYMEVPLEVSYKVVDQKLGLRVIGGVSSLFLLDNNVTLESQGSIMQVGEANNINSVNFSTNLGLGITYEAVKNIQFNVEPVVKYQLNTFSNVSGNFRPYALGIYSGLIYKF